MGLVQRENLIAGVDECNYSPSLAGDCMVCCLARIGDIIPGIKDSKKLTRQQRLELLPKIKKTCIYSVIPASPSSINLYGIYVARNLAISRAIKALYNKIPITKVYIDGYWSTRWLGWFESTCGCEIEGMINGDDDFYEISAASIVAKIAVDYLFDKYDRLYPGYGLASNHGSPSIEHYGQLRKLGATPVHRTGYQKDWWDRIYNGTRSRRKTKRVPLYSGEGGRKSPY